MNITKYKIVMVGDHMQLPATVFYPNSAKVKYNRSLFERLIDNDFPREILCTQYRMESNIRKFVGFNFYDNLLTDSKIFQEKMNNSIFYKIINKKINFSFFDIKDSAENFCQRTKSYYNEIECDSIITIIKNIYVKIKNFSRKNKNKKSLSIGNNYDNDYDYNYDNDNNDNNNNNNKNFKVAVIAPYKAQVKKLIQSVEKIIPESKDLIEINTVDSFQGREQDIVIISCVRSNINSNFSNSNKNYNNNSKKENIGFLDEYRRMNVALSRAKFACFVVGNFQTLYKNEKWLNLMEFCKENKSFFSFKEINDRNFSAEDGNLFDNIDKYSNSNFSNNNNFKSYNDYNDNKINNYNSNINSNYNRNFDIKKNSNFNKKEIKINPENRKIVFKEKEEGELSSHKSEIGFSPLLKNSNSNSNINSNSNSIEKKNFNNNKINYHNIYNQNKNKFLDKINEKIEKDNLPLNEIIIKKIESKEYNQKEKEYIYNKEKKECITLINNNFNNNNNNIDNYNEEFLDLPIKKIRKNDSNNIIVLNEENKIEKKSALKEKSYNNSIINKKSEKDINKDKNQINFIEKFNEKIQRNKVQNINEKEKNNNYNNNNIMNNLTEDIMHKSKLENLLSRKTLRK